MGQAFSTVVGWLLFAALISSTGSITARWLILQRAVPGGALTRVWLQDEAARVGRFGATMLPAAMVLVLMRQVGEFRDPFAPLAEDVGLLLGTQWGTTWLWALLMSVVMACGFMLAAAGRESGWWIATAAAIVLSSFPGLTGHAGGEEGLLRWLTLSADTLHVLAAGAWVGGLAVVLALERRWRRRRGTEEPASLLPLLAPKFSAVAMVSVGVLIGTGTLASSIHLSDVDALWSTGYGRLLTLKMVLVLPVLGLGALNWKRITPMLSTAKGPPAMRRAAAVELAVGTVVLFITSILVRTSPLSH